MSKATERLKRALGSEAFDALQAYLDERLATDVTFPGAEVRDESGKVTHIVGDDGTPRPV